MNPNYIINTFQQGLDMDSHPTLVKEGAYNFALNAVKTSQEYVNAGRSTEKSNELVHQFQGSIVGYVRIEERDSTVFFVKGSTSDIWIFNHNTNEAKKIISDADFGCNWNFSSCNWIHAIKKTIAPCNEVVVYFSANCTYYTVNIDAITDDNRKGNYNCQDFLLFRGSCEPKIKASILRGEGTNLEAGAYQFVARFADQDNNRTNFFDLSEPVYIGNDKNESGEISPDAIYVDLSYLDTSYSRVEVAVVKTIAGITTASLVYSGSYNSEGTAFTLYGKGQEFEPVSITEILVKKKAYLRGNNLMQKDGRIFPYQIKGESNINYQKYANQIQVKWKVYSVPANEASNYKSFMRDEVYAIGIAPNYIDQTKGPVFHIPGRSSIPSDQLGVSVSSCTKGTDCLIPYWQRVNTAVKQLQFCQDTYALNSQEEEICFCPANAECGDDCSVIIGDEPPPDPTEGCVNLNITFVQDLTDPLNNPCFNINVDITILVDGEERVINTNLSFSGETFTFSEQILGTTFQLLNIQSNDPNCPLEEPIVEILPCFDEGGRFAKTLDVDALRCKNGFCPTGSGGSTNWTCGSGGCGGSYSIGGSMSAKDPNEIRDNCVHSNSVYNSIMATNSQDDTTTSDVVNCADCNQDVIQKNLDLQEKKGLNLLETYADLLRTDKEVSDDCTLNTTNSFSEVSDKIAGFTNNAKKDELKFNKASFTRKSAFFPDGTRSSNNDQVGSSSNCEPRPIYGADGCTVVGYRPALHSQGLMAYWESEYTYPMDKDCDGNFLFGELAGKPIRHHKMPDTALCPTHTSTSMGVESRLDPTKTPQDDTLVHILGIELSNITIPDDSELPKPLCPRNPFVIMYVKRDGINKSIEAKGIYTHTFEGDTHETIYSFPSHGVNSYVNVDRYIENETETHFGVAGNARSNNLANFHSPDTNIKKNIAPVDELAIYYELFGRGWRYGLYAEGKKALGARENQIDRKGARQAINLNYVSRFTQNNGVKYHCVDNAVYALGDSVIKPSDDIRTPLMNKHREGSVYFKTRNGINLPNFTRSLAGDKIDYSFIGDGLDHESPVDVSNAFYGALKRNNRVQYGLIDSMTYIPLGLEQPFVQNGNKLSIEGDCGDSFVALYSFVRTSYISDKSGDTLNEDFADLNGGRITRRDYLGPIDTPRDVSMPPNRRGANLEEFIGAYDNTVLPETGDTTDPKNFVNLHPTYRWNEVQRQGITEAQSDIYYPRVQSTLVHFWCETNLNLDKRTTREAVLGEITYNNYNGWSYDPIFPSKEFPEETFLARFHAVNERPSSWQISLRTFIRVLLVGVIPAAFISGWGDDGTVLSLSIEAFKTPSLIAMWSIFTNYLATNEKLNQLLGIPVVKRDDQNGQKDVTIRGWIDNYLRVSSDFQKKNDITTGIAMPTPYNTCDCSSCGEYNNEIYYSAKQIIGSQIDAYRNFSANNLLTIPSNAGRLNNLFVRDGRFYAHTTDGIWLLQYGNGTIQTNEGIAILGSGDLLSSPTQLLEGVLEGYAGLSDDTHTINTAFGYFFVDEESKKFYRFSSQGAEDLTSEVSGVFNFMQRNLGFCNSGCDRQLSEGGFHYAIGADYTYNRVLLTKSDGESSFTVSYDPTLKNFVSFHSYIPQFYFFDRNSIYSVLNGGIYKHNKDNSFLNFYGDDYNFEIRFTSTIQNGLDSFQYDNTVLETYLTEYQGDSPKLGRRETFDNLYVYNSSQSTGTLDVVQSDECDDLEFSLIQNNKQVRTSWFNRAWQFNSIRDNFIDDSQPIFLKYPCRPYLEINEANHDCNSDDYEVPYFDDRWLGYGYIYKGKGNKELTIKSNITRIKGYENKQG